MHRMRTSTDAAVMAVSFAHALQDAWGVGDPACDNGVLVFYSQLEDQLVIAVGAAVQALLPADTLTGIVKEVRAELLESRCGPGSSLVLILVVFVHTDTRTHR